MTDSKMDIWDAHADIDPAFTKPITGKAYKGTSPNPQYVIKCLTETFGPVGQGFGWDVVAEEWQQVGSETIHWCRIKFWHTDRANTFDSYGQTRAAYTTANGKALVDEDAPKKSLTDAVIKAASQIGIAANIFLGRWDDQKYVAEVRAEFEESKNQAQRATETEITEAIEAIDFCETMDALIKLWNGLAQDQRHVALEDRVLDAKNAQKTKLTPQQKEAA